MASLPRKRASLCCTECNRRKVKCDKKIPCERCIDNGLQDACSRLGGTQVPYTPERSPSACTPQLSDLPTGSRSGISGEPTRLPPATSSVPPATAPSEEVTNAATILEFLAWGRRKDGQYIDQLSPCTAKTEPYLDEVEDAIDEIGNDHGGLMDQNMSLSTTQLLLPEPAMVRKLVQYHSDCLLWYHGSFHAPTFLHQLDIFYERLQGDISTLGVDLQWVALLFAILTGSIACGEKGIVSGWGFAEDEQEVLSKKWHQAVVTCLNSANYMAKPSIRSCEAIATLTMSAHILGYSNQQAVLLASAVRIAQGLGLHTLNDTSKKSLDRELGRRVWAQLCCQDWFSIPFSESYLINPLHSQTSDPINCDDNTLDEIPENTPTVTSYCRYLYGVASLMPKLQDGILTSNTMYTKYEQVKKYDRKMRSLATEQRPKFLCNVPVESSWPTWIPWARTAAAISSAHKILMIHRKFLSMSFTNPAFAFTRKTCIAAAKTILKQVSQLAHDDGPVLWISHAFPVAAGITLCLDALHRDASDPACLEHCKFVEETIEVLSQAHNSKIASRGVRILTDLLLLENRTRNERGGTKKRKAVERPTGGSSAKRRETIELGEIVRDLQSGRSPEQRRRRASFQVVNETAASQSEGTPYAQPNQQISSSTIDSNSIDLVAAEQMLNKFYSGYMASGGDPFGDLLNLAQTYN